jgi:hypothetical protein
MKFYRKKTPREYREKRKFLLWPRRLYSNQIIHRYEGTVWLEWVVYKKTRFFPAVQQDECWYTVMPVGMDIYKGDEF